MLTNKTLARINNRPRKIDRLPLLAVGGGTLALMALAALAYALGILPLLPHPRRPGRGRLARPPALREAEGQDDRLPLLQGQAGRRDRLPLLGGERSPGGPGLLGGDLEPARFLETAESGRGRPHPRARSGEGRAAPHAGHQGRRADLGDRGRRRDPLFLPGRDTLSTRTTATSQSRTTR